MTVTILIGDVREKLRELPADSFDCVVTSPPYWGLRKYLPAGSPLEKFEIGLEPTLGEHLAVMVDVFREVRRVLKPTGSLWLNYGDCYATTPNGRSAADTKAAGNDDRTFRDKPFSTIGGTLKAKDLAMIPNRLAIALQDDGWWVRSEIIWGKSNPMPESIKDRPSTAHEKIFMLTKSARYFYAADEVRQGRTGDEDANTFRGGSYVGGVPGPRQVVGNKRIGKQDATAGAAGAAGASSGRRMAGFNERWDAKERSLAKQYSEPYEGQSQKDYAGEGIQDPSDVKRRIVEGKMNGTIPDGRNLRNYEPAPPAVWVMGTSPFSDAHFATFPPELVERCLKAGCPKGGTVLDPFGGAGTTALVADQMQLNATIIELNHDYVHIAVRRIEADRGDMPNFLDPLQVDLFEAAT